MTSRHFALGTCMTLIAFAMAACRDAGEPAGQNAAGTTAISPASMARVGSVDERYQSYNVEMLEVTGGKFWAPYGPQVDAILKGTAGPAPGGLPAAQSPAVLSRW